MSRDRLVLAKPPKPVAEMTREEIRAWTRAIAEKLVERRRSDDPR